MDTLRQRKAGVIWILSEVFYPEETSTGHYMTAIAVALAELRDVRVLCARPGYSRKGQSVPRQEEYRGVKIVRVSGTTFNRHRLLLRLINVGTLTMAFAFRMLRDVRGADVVIVGTNPPTLPYLVWFALLGCRTRRILKVEDIYPDAMVAAGMIGRKHLLARTLGWWQRKLFANTDGVCALGRDMAALVKKRAGTESLQVRYIPNWSDAEDVHPRARADNALLRRLGLQEKFVVGFAGNFGPLQNIHHIVHCAELLRDDPQVHFLLVGSGKFFPWLESVQEAGRLTNVSLVGQRPRSEQEEFLNACDLGLISLRKDMVGVGVPSRTYNVMAAGKPILASVDRDSEIAQMVREEQIGWVVEPDDQQAFVGAIREAALDRSKLASMGQRARHAAETTYSRQRVLADYMDFLECAGFS